MQTAISLTFLTIFLFTTFLALLNLLQRLEEIPYLNYFKIRENHLKKLFLVLILEVTVALVPVGIAVFRQNISEYSYEDFHIISGDETEIFYRKPFKYIPSLKVENASGRNEKFTVIEQRKDGFKIKAYGVITPFKIYYFVIGVH